MTVPAALSDAAAEATETVKAVGDPVERYTVAVELAAWYQQQAIDIVAAAGPVAADED